MRHVLGTLVLALLLVGLLAPAADAALYREPGGPEAPEEEGYFSDELLKGRVWSGRVTGRFAYLQVNNTRFRGEECRTGPFSHWWSLRPKDEVSFQAPRRHPGH